MLGPPRPDHDGGDARLGEEPCEGERRLARAPLLRERGEAVEAAPHRVVVDEMRVRLRTLRHWRARGSLDPACVFPGEPASGERAERREAEARIRTQRQYLALRLAVEQRVRVLNPLA